MMASKQRVSLKRRQKANNIRNPISENDDDTFELKSPTRADSSDTRTPPALLSPSFRSPPVTKRRSSPRTPVSGNTSLDDSIGDRQSSQDPTPSKWNYLLPDFNSQPGDVVTEVHWDCVSPDAVKYLRRVRKDNSNIKELIKFVKEPSEDTRSTSPPIQLPLLRAALQRRMRKKPRDAEKRKQKKLARKRKQVAIDLERGKELFGQMLTAVAKREELEAKEREEKQSDPCTSAQAAAADSPEEDEDEDEDCWEDDDLFENNSFIIAATQDPYQFLKGSHSKTSTPILAEKAASQSKEVCTSSTPQKHDAGVNSGTEDSQSPEVIPPTYVTRRVLKPIARPRVLFGARSSGTADENEDASVETKDDAVFGGLTKENGHGSGKLEEKKPSNSSVFSSETEGMGKHYTHTKHSGVSDEAKPKSVNPPAVKGGQMYASSDKFSDDMSDDELFLTVAEPCGMPASQVIQEFPTQAATKLSGPATLASAKPGGAPLDDFSDDLDFEMLAKICEYDSSFSESPVVKKVQSRLGKTVAHGTSKGDKSPAHCENKQFRLQEGANKTSSMTSNGNTVSCRKAHNQRVGSAVSTKPKVVSSKAAQNSKHSWSSSSCARGAEPCQAEKQRDRGRPLSTLAAGNTVNHQPVHSGRKFTFKPAPSATANSAGHTLQSAPKARFGPPPSIPSKPSSNSGGGKTVQASSLDVSCSQLKLTSGDDDDLMDDDPLYESQIMAILDQVESQATQQMATQAAQQMATQASCSQGTSGTQPKCSQEEIEKKRQAAMQRRQQCKMRTK
ncbi:uncharacterized protein LOC143281270 [Babylonia areolata]|uniref:uncharacterized protein LOC143281270 n=1 Tax=Babylonia areolata TaxID=304850 RepID=UPI003FD59047